MAFPPGHEAVAGPASPPRYSFRFAQRARSASSSSNDDAAPRPRPGAKRYRVAHPENWKRNNRPRKVLAARPCTCSRKCFDHVSVRQRASLRRNAAAMTTGERGRYFASLIDLKPTRAARGAAALQIRRRAPRAFSATYHAQVGSVRKIVCQRAFMSFHGVGNTALNSQNLHSWTTRNDPEAPVSRPDGRGRHGRQASLPPLLIAKVVLFCVRVCQSLSHPCSPPNRSIDPHATGAGSHQVLPVQTLSLLRR